MSADSNILVVYNFDVVKYIFFLISPFCLWHRFIFGCSIPWGLQILAVTRLCVVSLLRLMCWSGISNLTWAELLLCSVFIIFCSYECRMISADGWGEGSIFTGPMTAGRLERCVIAVRPETRAVSGPLVFMKACEGVCVRWDSPFP